MSRLVLTPAAAMEIKRLYGLKDERGRQKHSQMEIASMLGVSETTVFRAIKSRGAYQALPEVKTEEDAAESMKRFAAAHANLLPEAPATLKLVQGIAEVKEKAQRGNALLDELVSGDERKLPDPGYD